MKVNLLTIMCTFTAFSGSCHKQLYLKDFSMGANQPFTVLPSLPCFSPSATFLFLHLIFCFPEAPYLQSHLQVFFHIFSLSITKISDTFLLVLLLTSKIRACTIMIHTVWGYLVGRNLWNI